MPAISLLDAVIDHYFPRKVKKKKKATIKEAMRELKQGGKEIAKTLSSSELQGDKEKYRNGTSGPSLICSEAKP